MATGGEIDGVRMSHTRAAHGAAGIVMALIQAANDNNTEVQTSIMASLRSLGKVAWRDGGALPTGAGPRSAGAQLVRGVPAEASQGRVRATRHVV